MLCPHSRCDCRHETLGRCPMQKRDHTKSSYYSFVEKAFFASAVGTLEHASRCGLLDPFCWNRTPGKGRRMSPDLMVPLIMLSHFVSPPSVVTHYTAHCFLCDHAFALVTSVMSRVGSHIWNADTAPKVESLSMFKLCHKHYCPVFEKPSLSMPPLRCLQSLMWHSVT